MKDDYLILQFKCKDYIPHQFKEDYVIYDDGKVKCKNSSFRYKCCGRNVNEIISSNTNNITCEDGIIYMTWTQYILYKSMLNIEEIPDEGKS